MMRPIGTYPSGLPARLKALRMARGLTQREVAAPLYTKAYISMLESGKTRCSMKALVHFSERLDVSLPELMGGLPKNGKPSLGAIPTPELIAELQRRVMR